MDKALRIVAITLLCASLASCGATMGNLCTVGPVILDQGANDRLTRSEKEQITTLNNSGADICGWRQPQ